MKDDSGNIAEEILGQLNVVAYDKQIIKLVIVPVGDSKSYRQSEINARINDIYSQSVVEWDINWLSPFTTDEWDINNDRVFDNTDKDNRMDYTPAMKALIRAFSNEHKPEKHAVYVFLFNGSIVSKDLQGYMPFNKQYGFVFTQHQDDPRALAHDIAHEIAHGTFNLRHTFSNENVYYQPRGTTNNLMDYASSTSIMLNKYQWDLIHDPESVLFSWLEEEEEGAGIFGGKLVLLDERYERYTLLLNHVYDKNHEGKLVYKDKIEKSRQISPTEIGLDLDYNGSKEKEWIHTWKLRTSTSDEILAKIIKKIQNAEKGKKIEKMSLNEKGIYIGKYKLDDVEYPIAIYSEKSEISNLVKVQVSDIDDLDKDENKKHIKSEETFIKYMIIAFYEEGTSNPVLVMQVEKFDISKMQNTKEKWLKFLNIFVEKKENSEKLDEIFTEEKLKELYPKVDEKVIKDIFTYISEYKDEYGVDDCNKLIHFLTQADHESGGFRYIKEIGSFTGDREKYKGRGIFQLTWEGNYEKFQEHLKTKNIDVDLVKHPELVEETKYAVLSALWYWQRNNLSDYAIDLKVSSALKISKLVNCGNLNYCGCEKDEEGNCKKDEKGNKIKCTDCAPNGWDDRKSKFEKYKNQISCE